MKQEFSAFYPPTQEEFDDLWRNALIVLDTSVLLNLYNYSENTRDEVLNLLEEIKDRLWIPFQVASEYHNGRITAIDREHRKYAVISGNLKSVKSELEANRRHPFVTTTTMEEFDEVFTKLLKELDEGAQKLQDWIHDDDPIRDRLTEIFSGRVGESNTEAELESLYKEGESRFGKNVPPGYCDVKKPEPQRYGDLVVWKQLVAHAKSRNTSAILVVDDSKEDWWHLYNKTTKLGPRRELLIEFRKEAGQACYLYSSESFVENARSKLSKDISDSTVNEIRQTASESMHTELDQIALMTPDSTVQKLLEDSAALRASLDPTVERLMQDSATFRAAFEPSIQQLMRDSEAFRTALAPSIQQLLQESAAFRAAFDPSIQQLMRDSMALRTQRFRGDPIQHETDEPDSLEQSPSSKEDEDAKD